MPLTSWFRAMHYSHADDVIVAAGDDLVVAHCQAHLRQRGGRPHEPAALLQPRQWRPPPRGELQLGPLLGSRRACWQDSSMQQGPGVHACMHAA